MHCSFSVWLYLPRYIGVATRSSGGGGGRGFHFDILTDLGSQSTSPRLGGSTATMLVRTCQLLVLDKVRLWLVDEGERFLVTILGLTRVDVV